MNTAGTDTRRTPRTPLSGEAVELVSAQLRVMAEPNRIRILELLDGGGATVQQLADQMETTYQNVSKHLRVLFAAGMVKRTPEGPAARYTLIDWTGVWVVEQLAQALSDRPG
jgi:DNA-binding transcriptional ArsR family regulator